MYHTETAAARPHGLPDRGMMWSKERDHEDSGAGLVYAFVMSGEPRRPGRTSDTGGIFRSDDAGESWQRVSPKLASRTYYTDLNIDPSNASAPRRAAERSRQGTQDRYNVER